MAITATFELKDNVIELTAKGWKITQKWLVEGLTSTGDQRIFDAMTGLTAQEGISVGSVHPIKTLVPCTSMVGKTIDSKTAVEITVLYEQQVAESVSSPGTYETTIEISASLTQEQTNRDYAGTVITVPYTGAEGNGTSTETQGGTVPKLVPSMTKTITTMYSGDPTTYIQGRIGCLISGTSQKELIWAVSARSKDGGILYEYSETHAWKNDSWNVDVYWINPKTGKPARDAALNNGYVTKRLYTEI